MRTINNKNQNISYVSGEFEEFKTNDEFYDVIIVGSAIKDGDNEIIMFFFIMKMLFLYPLYKVIRGVLCVGLIINSKFGFSKLPKYNCRFGNLKC
jgi:hypothetical protein